MSAKYEKLFERGRIGTVELKNRIVMPPMGTGMASFTGEASPEIIRYYEERAKGGCGLIITEITCIDEDTGLGGLHQLHATSNKYIPGLMKLAHAVHRHDSKVFLQLHHPGREVGSAIQPAKEIVAPSAIPCGVVQEMPRAMTTDECEAMAKKYVRGAVIAKMAGIDGVEIHGSHGYLVNQFLSPYTNKRTDRYGGDFFGRMRFIAEIVVGIRQACGPMFPISVRISADEFLEGGITSEESVKIARYLESINVSAINVSCGTYETGNTIVEPYFRKEGWKKHLAKAIKENVKIPVIAVNTVKHPAFAESLLEEGVSDFVAIGRGQLADAEWGNKAKCGCDDDIRKCIGCMNCFRAAFMGLPIVCNINPNLGLETIYNEDTLKKDGEGRTVAIVGAGAAGLQAAIVLGKRGFKPVVLEKNDHVGGSVVYAAKAPGKEMIGEFIQTLEKQARDAGADIRLNTVADVDSVKALNPYGVMVATGGETMVIPVPGHDKSNVYKAPEVIMGDVTLKGKNVVVIGGGNTGLEVAELLGPDNNVTVVEMMGDVGAGLYPSVKRYLLATLGEMGVTIKTMEGLTEITDNKVILRNSATAFKTELEADAVIMASGVKIYRELTDKFYAAFDKVTTIGDATRPGLIGEALREANSKAYVF